MSKLLSKIRKIKRVVRCRNQYDLDWNGPPWAFTQAGRKGRAKGGLGPPFFGTTKISAFSTNVRSRFVTVAHEGALRPPRIL